jgi:hypothetical protein
MAYCLRKAEIANLIALCGFALFADGANPALIKKRPLMLGR